MTELNSKNLTVEGRTGLILDSVAVKLGPGELLGLIGPNGAGKTTLLRCLLGLLKPTSGEINLDGKSLGTWKRKDIAKRIGYLPQGAPCHWPMTVEKIVKLGRTPHQSTILAADSESEELVEGALQITRTTHLRHRVVTSLSGGERTLVMIARCLVSRSGLLLADEPVTGLDPRHQIEIIEALLSSVTKDAGVLMVLHDLSLAAKYCTRLILLHEGRVADEGHPTSVLTSKNLADVYGINASLQDVSGQRLVVCLDVKN